MVQGLPRGTSLPCFQRQPKFLIVESLLILPLPGKKTGGTFPRFSTFHLPFSLQLLRCSPINASIYWTCFLCQTLLKHFNNNAHITQRVGFTFILLSIYCVLGNKTLSKPCLASISEFVIWLLKWVIFNLQFVCSFCISLGLGLRDGTHLMEVTYTLWESKLKIIDASSNKTIGNVSLL